MVQMGRHSRQEHSSKFPKHTRKPCRILRLRKRLRQERLVLVSRAGPGNARECRGQPPDVSSEKSVPQDSCHIKSLSRELLRNRCPLSIAASRTSISCSRVAKYARKSLRCTPAPSSTGAPAPLPAETSPDLESRSSMAVTAESAGNRKENKGGSRSHLKHQKGAPVRREMHLKVDMFRNCSGESPAPGH